jgi:peroxiredoxin Q/BCP
VVILGISKDSMTSHFKFAQKLDLNFHLLSDPDKKVHEAFGVIKEKKLYGKISLGTERSTFVMDENRVLIKEYRKVKAKGHAQEVLKDLRELSD